MIKKLEMAHFTSHDLRRTAATHLGALGVPPVVIDAILNHKDGSVGAIYNRYAYAKEKRQALEAWACRLSEIVREIGSKVALLHRARKKEELADRGLKDPSR